jgi:hypothetical protein
VYCFVVGYDDKRGVPTSTGYIVRLRVPVNGKLVLMTFRGAPVPLTKVSMVWALYVLIVLSLNSGYLFHT